MNPVFVDDGSLLLQDPADVRVYVVDWSTNLPSSVSIAQIPTVTIRSLNAEASALFKTVSSWVYDGASTVTITTTTPHGYVFGNLVTISGANEPAANFINVVLSVVSPTMFTMGFAGVGAFTATGFITASIGIDWVDYSARVTQCRFTNALINAHYELTTRIVTDETPAQTKERSFQVLVQNL